MCDLIGLIPSTREVEENNWIIDDKTPFVKCLNTNKELKVPELSANLHKQLAFSLQNNYKMAGVLQLFDRHAWMLRNVSLILRLTFPASIMDEQDLVPQAVQRRAN